jgi:signal transduction histidine kinase
MLNIINDIINISKVESGQIEVLKTETDINDITIHFNSLK